VFPFIFLCVTRFSLAGCNAYSFRASGRLECIERVTTLYAEWALQAHAVLFREGGPQVLGLGNIRDDLYYCRTYYKLPRDRDPGLPDADWGTQ
jgi:hypothetical protein